MGPLEVTLIILGAILLVIGLYLLSTYNRFVRLRVLVRESFSQVEVELKRRHDLIPNLVETVKGYAKHEQAVFTEVTRLRAEAVQPGLSVEGRAQAENGITALLDRLLAVAENYPALQASGNYLQLQRELTITEDRIAAGRRFYNSNVRELNTATQQFPSSIVAGWFNFSREPFFELRDPSHGQLPGVNFR